MSPGRGHRLARDEIKDCLSLQCVCAMTSPISSTFRCNLNGLKKYEEELYTLRIWYHQGRGTLGWNKCLQSTDSCQVSSWSQACSRRSGHLRSTDFCQVSSWSQACSWWGGHLQSTDSCQVTRWSQACSQWSGHLQCTNSREQKNMPRGRRWTSYSLGSNYTSDKASCCGSGCYSSKSPWQ